MAQEAPAPATEAEKTEAPAPVAAASKGVRVHVQNLAEDMTSEALLALFAPHGTTKGGEVKTTEDGKCKGFGFVIMSTEEEAKKAIAEVNGTKQGEKELNVFLAPVKDKGKGDAKGKGKGTDSKGKGKNKSYPAYPDPYAMYQAPYVDPMQAYAAQVQGMQLMQQMYMTQLYAQAQMQMAGMATPSAQPQQSTEKSKGKTKGKPKGKGKGGDKGGTKVDGTFTGRLKSLSMKEDRGYGFIECAETMAAYNRDVFISSEFVPQGAEIGDQLQFSVTLSDKGHPRAANVVKVGGP